MTLDDAMRLVEDLARRNGPNPCRTASGIALGLTAFA
jgi:hypothetical protein